MFFRAKRRLSDQEMSEPVMIDETLGKSAASVFDNK
jgi:hypothetical protein